MNFEFSHKKLFLLCDVSWLILNVARFARNAVKWDILSDFKTLWRKADVWYDNSQDMEEKAY